MGYASRLRRDVEASGRGWWPLLSASAMAGTDHAYGYALVVLAPEIARSLDLPISAVAALAMFRAIAFFVSGGLVAAALSRRTISTTSLASSAASVRVAALVLTGLCAAPWALVAGVALYGLAGISTPLAHREILEAAYGRSEVVDAFHRGALRIGNVIVAAAIAPVVLLSPSRWRSVFVVLAVMSAVGPLSALLARARDRSRGVVPLAARPDANATHEPAAWLLTERGSRMLPLAFAVGGLFEVPLYIYAFGGLSTRWAIDAPSRAVVAAAFELLGVALGAAAVRHRLRRHRTRGATAAPVVGVTMLCGAAVLVASMASQRLGSYVTLMALAMGMLGFMAPMLFTSTLTMLPPLRREIWGGLPSALLVAVAVSGSAALAWVASAFGDQAAVACFAALPALLGLLVILNSRSLDPIRVPAWWSRWPLPALTEAVD